MHLPSSQPDSSGMSRPPLVRACALPPFISGDFSLSLAPLSCLARRDRPAGGSGLALARCPGCQGARDFFFILFVASGRWQLVSLTCWTELCLSGLFCLCSDIYFCGGFLWVFLSHWRTPSSPFANLVSIFLMFSDAFLRRAVQAELRI